VSPPPPPPALGEPWGAQSPVAGAGVSEESGSSRESSIEEEWGGDVPKDELVFRKSQSSLDRRSQSSIDPEMDRGLALGGGNHAAKVEAKHAEGKEAYDDYDDDDYDDGQEEDDEEERGPRMDGGLARSPAPRPSTTLGRPPPSPDEENEAEGFGVDDRGRFGAGGASSGPVVGGGPSAGLSDAELDALDAEIDEEQRLASMGRPSGAVTPGGSVRRAEAGRAGGGGGGGGGGEGGGFEGEGDAEYSHYRLMVFSSLAASRRRVDGAHSPATPAPASPAQQRAPSRLSPGAPPARSVSPR